MVRETAVLPRGLSLVLREFAQAVRQSGLREAGGYLFEAVARRIDRAERAEGFDLRFGTDTATIVYPWQLPSTEGERAREFHGYEATPSWLIREILSRIPLLPDRFAFVDLGSGKGRTLLVASEFPFAKIIGVELSHELHQIAGQNISRYRSSFRRCTSFSLQCIDAAKYAFEPLPLVVFMFNPFGKNTVRAVLANLEASLIANPRDAFVIYLNPRFEPLLRDARVLRKAIEHGAWWRPWRRYLIYEVARVGRERVVPLKLARTATARLLST